MKAVLGFFVLAVLNSACGDIHQIEQDIHAQTHPTAAPTPAAERMPTSEVDVQVKQFGGPAQPVTVIVGANPSEKTEALNSDCPAVRNDAVSKYVVLKRESHISPWRIVSSSKYLDVANHEADWLVNSGDLPGNVDVVGQYADGCLEETK